KILLFFMSVFLISFSAGLFFFAKKIEPKEIHKYAIELLQKSSPESTFSIGEVDYSLGFSVSVFIKDIQMMKQDKKVACVVWVEFRMSLWFVYFGGGNIDVKVMNTVISKFEDEKTNEQINLKSIHKNLKLEEIEIPHFLVKNKLNIRFMNISYQSELEQIEIDTLLLKNINMNGFSAFEIIQKKESHPYHLQVVGELNIKKLLETSEAKISFFANISDLKLKNNSLLVPDIKINGKGELSANGELKATISAKASDLLTMKFNAFFG